MVVDGDDWRRQGQERYLVGRSWKLEPYVEPRAGWDHDHCEYCGAKLGDAAEQKAAYVSVAPDHRCICEACFADFRGELAPVAVSVG